LIDTFTDAVKAHVADEETRERILRALFEALEKDEGEMMQ
jgi:hypothetical protein